MGSPEIDRLVQEIRDAFADVRLGNGISWAESHVLTYFGSDKQRAAARGQTPDRPWIELVDDHKHWETEGSFIFLDPEGVRYYLPAALTRVLLYDDWESGVGHVIWPVSSLQKSPDQRWNANIEFLTDAQRRTVARVFKHWADEEDRTNAECGYERGHSGEAIFALREFWGRFLA